MEIDKQYIYLPDNSLVILSQFIPIDGWVTRPGYLISINTTTGIQELEFASQNSIKLLMDALQELLNTTNEKDISIKAFEAEDNLF